MPIPGTRLPSHLQASRRATWRRKLKRQRRPRRRKPLRKRRSRFSDGHHLANIGNYTSPAWPAGRTATTGVDSITFGRRAFLLACRPDLLTRRWIEPGALAYGSRKRCSHQRRIADFVGDPRHFAFPFTACHDLQSWSANEEWQCSILLRNPVREDTSDCQSSVELFRAPQALFS